MRKVVVIENKQYPFGFVEPAALYSENWPIPIEHGGMTTRDPLGWALNFQRDYKSGEISYELRFVAEQFEDEKFLKMFDVAAMFQATKQRQEDGRIFIERAEIVAIYLHPIAAIPRDFRILRDVSVNDPDVRRLE